jgi:hypothetical protein
MSSTAAATGSSEHQQRQDSNGGGGGMLRVVVEGCCHGELDQVQHNRWHAYVFDSSTLAALLIVDPRGCWPWHRRLSPRRPTNPPSPSPTPTPTTHPPQQIYASIGRLEQASGQKVDLLICCGDFQAVRNKEDLATMNVPSKYLTMASFHRYYSGEAVAPVLTLFIGGNHEASNYLQELYYGGWVAPNIYYLGCSGVVRVGGVRVAGLSGIYNGRHYKYVKGWKGSGGGTATTERRE